MQVTTTHTIKLQSKHNTVNNTIHNTESFFSNFFYFITYNNYLIHFFLIFLTYIFSELGTWFEVYHRKHFLSWRKSNSNCVRRCSWSRNPVTHSRNLRFFLRLSDNFAVQKMMTGLFHRLRTSNATRAD